MFKRLYFLLMAVTILLMPFVGQGGSEGTLRLENSDDFLIAKYIKIHSEILKEERTMVVHLPKGYSKTSFSYPVLYTLDADWKALFTMAAAAPGYLNAFGYIPKLIVVGICSTDRNRDMIPVTLENEPTSGGADLFLKFISEELIPFIDKNYRTEPFRILYGGSYAGLFTVNAFLEKPDIFKAYIASSPGIGVCPEYLYAKVDKLFKNIKTRRRFLYLIYGEHDYPQSTGYTQDFYNYMKSKSPEDFKCWINIIENEGHVPFIGLYDGLRYIFADWMFPEERRASAGLNEIKQHFSRIEKIYGYKVVIPAHILIGLGYYASRQGKISEAIEALLLACELHPYSPDAFYYLGEAYEKNNQISLALQSYQKALAAEPAYLLAKQKIDSYKNKEQSINEE